MIKRLFSSALTMAIVSSVFAQNNAVCARLTAPAKETKKSIYYLKPEGVPFEVTPKNGKMAGTSYLYVPGYSKTKFVPVVPENTKYFWHQNVYDMNGNCRTFDRTGKTSNLFSTDNDGSFNIITRFNGADALPTIVCETDSFTLSEENPHWGPLDYDLPAVMYWYPRIKSGTSSAMDSHIRPLQFTDDKVNNFYLGGMDNGYLFGSGTISNGEYTSRGVQQILEKPVAPLWVEDVFLPIISKSSKPLPNGTELTMLITNVETDVHFSSAIVSLPGFLIDKEFAVIVRGFDQPGVDMGLSGAGIPYYNKVLSPALCLIKTKDGKNKAANIYADNNIALSVTFSAKFDYANGYVDAGIETSYNYGLVLMNNEGTEGQTTCTQGLVFPGAVAQLNGMWYDDNKKEEYTLSGIDSWIKSYTIDEESYREYGLTVIKFTCDPLPSNVAGRKCDILIHGKGVVSDKPITVVQGDVTAAINNVHSSNTIKEGPNYNIAGQRVGNDYKGIIIKNGKKQFNK